MDKTNGNFTAHLFVPGQQIMPRETTKSDNEKTWRIEIEQRSLYVHSEAAISSKLKSETVLMFEALYCSKYMEFRNILYHNRKMKDDISCMYKFYVIKPL